MSTYYVNLMVSVFILTLNLCCCVDYYEDMVIMSAEVYNRIRLFNVYEKLMEAERDIAEGKVSDAFDAMNTMRSKYGL